MKNPNFQNLILIVSLAVLSPLLASSIASSPEVDLTGIWRGVIDPDGSGIELVFHIESSGETGWRGTAATKIAAMRRWAGARPLDGSAIVETMQIWQFAK